MVKCCEFCRTYTTRGMATDITYLVRVSENTLMEVGVREIQELMSQGLILDMTIRPAE